MHYNFLVVEQKIVALGIELKINKSLFNYLDLFEIILMVLIVLIDEI
jgi:hypothetical protein